jgi:general secretion pathway protein D
MSRKLFSLTALAALVLASAACPRGGSDYKKGQQAELQQDYDTALIHYERAFKANPKNAAYQIRARRMRFLAAQTHVDRGHKLRDQGLLEPAAAEFEKALAIDPSSFVAEQELRRTLEQIVAQRQAQAKAAAQARQAPSLLPASGVPDGPTQLQPVSRAPFDLKMTEDARRIYESIAKLAGINVIFDPEFQGRRITLELTQATLEQALDITSLMTKSFWKAVTPNTIMVVPDNPAKRRSYEEQILKTFYLSNTIQAAELNEIVQTLRTLLDIKRITPSTANNAIIIRDTPDKVAVAEKVIRDIDQAKPEVLIQVAVLQARRDRARELGIVPSSSVPLLFTPRSLLQPAGGDTDGDTSGTAASVTLDNLKRLSSADYSVVLPSATAMALLTDATTRVVQNPEVRATDMQTAKLRIGDKVPFAVGSFQPGIGGVGINPLVNTQFQFQDVGVNLDITPRVHSNREISLRVKVEVSSVTGRVSIGGIDQPIFGQRVIEHDIRLREGEVNILGGIIERSEANTISGWPGLAQIPFLRYLFSSESKEVQENEVLIVLTPRILRLPEISALNLRPLAVGTDENIVLPRPREAEPEPAPPAPPAPALPESKEQPPPQAAAPTGPPTLRFQPAQARVTAGESVSVDVAVENVTALFAVPFALRFDPQVVELVEVHHGGFLGGEQPVALVHRVDKEAGTAIVSLSRPPGSGGTSGSGTLVTLVFKGVAAGRSPLQVQNAAARDAQQQPVRLQISAGEILVEAREP